MIFLENLKPLKIYKRPMFLPTVDGDKKKKSAIFLLTPNYESSKATMTSDLFINKLRFASYYIEKDLTYFISSKAMNKVEDVTETYVRDFSEYDFYQSLCEMNAAERNALKDSTFGLPSKRKYPLNDEDHVRSAIRFFNYVDSSDEAELARNIKKAIKKFHMKVNVGEKNRFSKYYTAPATESALLEMTVSSNIDKDFKAKGKKDLSEYRKEKITKELAAQHKEFKHVRYDTDNCVSFWDGSDLVGYVCVENKDYYHWITALEVMPPYQGYGLGTQILKYAIDTMNADALSVSKKNNIAYEMYKNAGFYVFKDDSNMYYMTTDSTKAALNTESVDLAIYEGKVSKRNNGNYTYRFYDDDNTEVCEVSMDYGDEDNPGNYIYDFKVMKDYRNQGIGTSLLEYAITDLGGDRLVVDKGNRVALHMYEEAGFEITGDDNSGRYTMSLNEDKLSAKDRNALRDSTFGVPSKRKFPLNDESHVRSAIRFFNKVAPEDEETLARNIKKAIKKFNMTVNVGKNNRFSKYYTGPVTEASEDENPMQTIQDLYDKLITFNYGIKKNGKVLDLDGKEFADAYRLQSPSDFEKSETGVCWDFCLYESDQLKKAGIPHTNYYIELPDTPNSDTHTFTVANVGDQLVYIEVSFHKIRGIYTAKKIDDIFNYVLSNMVADYEGTYKYEIHKFSDYTKYGATTLQFMDYMINTPTVKKGTIKGGKVIDKGIIKESTGVVKEDYTDNVTNTPDTALISVSGIITEDNKILLEDHIKCNAYTLPGGKAENNETVEEAICRELKEELGIDVSENDIELLFVNTFECEYPAGSGSYTWFKDYCYRIKAYSGNIKLMEPHKHKSIILASLGDIGNVYKPSQLLETILQEINRRFEEMTVPGYISLDKITCTGYLKDLEPIRRIATRRYYWSILQSLGLQDIEAKYIPKISIVACDCDEMTITTDAHGDTVIQIMYPKDDDISDPAMYVTRWIIFGLLKSLYTKIPDSIIDLFSRYVTDAVSDNEKTMVTDYCNGRTIAAALKDMSEEFNPSDWLKMCKQYKVDRFQTIDDIMESAAIQEKKEMTAQTLTNSLKYRGSTKNKIAVGKLKNSSKHLNDDILSSLEIEGPKTPDLPKAPSVPSAKTSNKPSSNEGEEKSKDEETPQIKESMLEALANDEYIIYGDYVTFFTEDAKNDSALRKILYSERLVKRKEVVALLDRVKADCPFIKYAYTDISRYQQKNLFVDLYYYNQAFFKNNEWKGKKAFNLYSDLLDRLINDKRIKKAGYTRRTVFIPVLDWRRNPSTRMWMYKEDLNPISVIYQLMYYDPATLKKLFKGVDIVFFTNNIYFTIDTQNANKKDANKFRSFIMKIMNNEEFESDDVDTTEDTPSKKAIKTTIMDDIDVSKGVDLTAADTKVQAKKKTVKTLKRDPAEQAVKKTEVKKTNAATKTTTTTTKLEPVMGETRDPAKKKAKNVAVKNAKEEEKVVKDTEKKMTKSSANKPATDDNIKADDEIQQAIIQNIDNHLDDDNSITDVDTAYDSLDDDDELKDLLVGLDSMKDDAVNISQARADRMSELDRELLDKTVKGRTVREIIQPDKDPTKPAELPETSLKVGSPNQEWKDLTYMNFDKSYDMEKDIINSFEHFTTVSRPMAIRNITAVDNSTSEDYVDTYTCEYEDYRGKRYTIKLDIPKVKNERFVLRGNTRMLQTQFFNMPIIKTNNDVCQIVTNYKKIIISRYNTAAGKSMPNVSRLIKAADKYKGNRIKFIPGDNTLICAKYNLPIDYIDLASVFSKIETDSYTFYFNQDDIRNEYEIDDIKGTPFAISKKDGTIMYYSNSDTIPFCDHLAEMISIRKDNGIDKDFYDLYESMNPTAKGTYTRAKIMGSEIPLVVICGYHDGLTTVMKKSGIKYQLLDKLTPEIRKDIYKDWIRFSDGYLVYDVDYNSSLLLNGLKDCDCNLHSMMEIDDKNMYLEFLDEYGGRIKADGLDNFYDCEIDPITKETLEYYQLPTEYVSCLLYANRLLADNKFIKHTNASSRRARRFELVAAYTYQVLAEAYSDYANSVKHNRNGATFSCKQSAVIDKILSDPTSSDYSTINMLNDIESTNAITTKGLSGLNADRSYSLDKRTYDDSMLNVVGMSTGFAGNVGITRQATMDMNIEGERGYVKNSNGNLDSMNTAKTLTATEAVVPLSTTHDDPFRVAMTFIQSSKHAVRTEHSDPLLVTNGADEALPYMCSDQFAFKAKQDGTITELTDEGMIVEYKDGTKEYVNLTETIEKNSDGGFYVPLKLDAADKLKVGSKVKANQIIAYDKSSLSNSAGEDDDLAYDVGTLCKVAIINTDEGFEDSGIVTERLAKKLTARIITMADCILDKNTNIYNMAKVGQKVEQGDALLVWQTPYDEEEVNNLLKALADDSEAISELGRHTVRSEVTGTLVGIKMYRTVELNELSDSLKKALKAYEKPITELKKKLDDEGIDTTTLPANYPLKPAGKLKKAGDGVLIEFYIEYDDIVGVGDKITYNAANKAVIKSVIPEGKEPYTDFRPNEPISALVSSTSIAKRMVTSTRVYGYLQKLMVELDRSCKDLAGIPYDDTDV